MRRVAGVDLFAFRNGAYQPELVKGSLVSKCGWTLPCPKGAVVKSLELYLVLRITHPGEDFATKMPTWLCICFNYTSVGFDHSSDDALVSINELTHA
jgi:hypothetical protein